MANTPLHFATRSIERVRMLLNHGADPAARNANGHTPLEKALAEGEADVAAVLRADG